MPFGRSTILSIQESLLKKVNPNIIINIVNNETLLIAANVSEDDFANLIFVTNSPSFGNSYMYLINIEVYLDNNLEHTEIYGLLPIVSQQVEQSDANAYINAARTHQPFINGFQGGITISQLINELSVLSVNTPDTYGKVKKFKLYIDPLIGGSSGTITGTTTNTGIVTPTPTTTSNDPINNRIVTLQNTYTCPGDSQCCPDGGYPPCP